MKRNSKILIVFLVLLMATGCGNKQSTNAADTKKQNESEVKETKVNLFKTSKIKRDEITSITPANITETVIFDRENVKVTAKSISYDHFEGPHIILSIENNSAYQMTVQSRLFSINGIMIYPLFSTTVNAGETSEGVIRIMEHSLKEAEISTIKDIEFTLAVSDNNKPQNYYYEPGIKLETDAVDYVQTDNKYGVLVSDSNDVKIYVFNAIEPNSLLGSTIYVYIENNSEKTIAVRSNDLLFDGEENLDEVSVDMKPGTKAFERLIPPSSSEEEIKNMDIRFNVYEYETFSKIFGTDNLRIEFDN